MIVERNHFTARGRLKA